MSESEEATQRLMDGSSWDQFCDTLKAAGKVIQAETAPSDPLSRAEGYRYLSRLTRAALEAFVENNDPKAPMLIRPVHETAKIGADNPDNYYQYTCVSGEFDYRIWGNRGTVARLSFGSQAGNYGSTGGSAPTGSLNADELEIDKDGNFEIIVSSKEHPGNWLPMAPDSEALFVRQTFLDRENEVVADLQIERLADDKSAGLLTPEMMAQGLTSTGNLVLGISTLFATWAEDFKKEKNLLPHFDTSKAALAGGDPSITYYHGYFELTPDEALVIDVTPPDCDYWNFQLNNYWMESLDYRFFPIVINKHSAVLGEDGSVRVVVSSRNPGVDNWLDTAGHNFGTMCWRWVCAEEFPEPKTRVMKISELEAGG
ncbi:MAG: DUF1214 domain-containing protein [Deltaproteobacteria bacterium]|nr:DUF1214 domain-containing protein [Deltaproteobacteria bacterium]